MAMKWKEIIVRWEDVMTKVSVTWNLKGTGLGYEATSLESFNIRDVTFVMI